MEYEKDCKPFPIMQDFKRESSGKVVTIPSCTVPWWLAEVAYEYYHSKWRGQTLERLAERGGFSREELICFIRREK